MIKLPDRISTVPREEQSHGLRLSGYCPAKRIITYFEGDSWDFDPGIGERGNDVARKFTSCVLIPNAHPGKVLIEHVVPWGGGRWNCHVDAVITAGEFEGPWELKSHQDGGAPNEEEITQLARYLWAIEKYDENYVFPVGYLAVINPNNYRIHGPWEVRLTDEMRRQFDQEEAATLAFFENLPPLGEDAPPLYTDPRIKELCICGKCHLDPVVEIDADENPKLRKLMLDLDLAMEQGDKEQEKRLRVELASWLNPGQRAVSDLFKLSASMTNPQPRVKRDFNGAFKAGLIPPEVMAELEAAGWVANVQGEPTLAFRRKNSAGRG